MREVNEVLIRKSSVVPIGKIKPYWNNPREENDAAAESVAESIRRYGFNQPIVVDANYVIIVGHKRYKGALILGLKKVPVIVADNLSEEQARAYRIVDNSTNDLTGWDNSKLVTELRAIPSATDLVGLVAFDIDGLLKDIAGIGRHAEVTDEDIEGARLKPIEQGENGSIDLYCPHCGEPITIDKAK